MHLSFVLVYVGDLVTTNLMKHGHKWHMDGACQSYRRFWLLQALSTFVIIPQRSLMASITQYKSSKPVFSHGLMLLFWHATLVLVKKATDSAAVWLSNCWFTSLCLNLKGKMDWKCLFQRVIKSVRKDAQIGQSKKLKRPISTVMMLRCYPFYGAWNYHHINRFLS